MKERKIFNFKSKILKEETIKEFGYDPDTLGNSSSKFVIAICRFCGKQHKVRKGFFIKSGSACHKECKIKEMKKQCSPFSDPEIRKKAKKKIKEKYGSEYASQNKEIAKKISNVRLSKENKDKIKKTNLKRYGVENPFQSEEIKDKIKKTNIKKYGVDHPLKSEDIKEKMKQTNVERYGVDNPLKNKEIRKKIENTNMQKYGCKNPQQNKDIKNKTQHNFNITIGINEAGHYDLVNTLRGQDFWDKLLKNSLKKVCEDFDLNYQSATAALLKDEFRDRYYSTYTFPTQQKQKELYDWLKEEGSNVSFNDRSIITPLELDIVDKDKKVAVEFNGSFWHSEANLSREKAKKTHIEKTRLCNEKGYRLVHVFEHTYLQRENQVKTYLKSVFGLNKKKIAARKCIISHSNSDDFIEKYHIQGTPRGTIKYFNLVYNGDTVGVMTAGKHHERGGDKKACILTRLVFKDGVTVQGGSSKLFKYFREWSIKSGYDNIISWSDNIFSEGNIYSVLDFSLEKEYPPSYFYYDHKKQKYCNKQSQRQTNKNRPEGMTIVDWNNSRRMYVIWDCGKKKWVYNLTKINFCEKKEIIDICDQIKKVLSFDLIKKEYQGDTPIHGACYIATESLYHILKEKYDIKIKRYTLEDGVSHWWAEYNKEIIDITKEQFDFVVPYYFGKKAAFLTKDPSKRCKKILERIEGK
jgi:hypothetical protein